MKWFAILFIGFLVEGTTEPDDGLDLKVNLSLMTTGFSDGAKFFPIPTIEYGDHVASQKFAVDFTTVGNLYGQVIVDLIHSQGQSAGEHLVQAVQKDYEIFKKSMKTISKKDKKSKHQDPDHCLKVLNEQLRTFLDLKPGKDVIEQLILPALPLQPIEVKSRTENRTATELFLDLQKFHDDDFALLYGYVAGIFLSGWKQARNNFHLIQTQYRNEFLNGPVMDAYKKVVNKIWKKRDLIECQVKEETWKTFEKFAQSIIKVSDDYKKSLDEKRNGS